MVGPGTQWTATKSTPHPWRWIEPKACGILHLSAHRRDDDDQDDHYCDRSTDFQVPAGYDTDCTGRAGASAGRVRTPGMQEFWFLLTCMAAGRPVSAERHGDQGPSPLGWPSPRRRSPCLSRCRSRPTACRRNQLPRSDANAACTVNGSLATVAAAFATRRSPSRPRLLRLPRSRRSTTRGSCLPLLPLAVTQWYRPALACWVSPLR